MNTTPDDAAAKKIIIDEDWKAQVEAEREALREKQEAAGGGPAERPATQTRQPPSPASLTVLISSLAFQAMMSLGLVADPKSGPPQPHFDEARHLIDMLQMLDDKTTGNRTSEESRLLENTLHDLRMAYVAVQSQPLPPAAEEKS
jgi:hypothetical protein